MMIFSCLDKLLSLPVNFRRNLLGYVPGKLPYSVRVPGSVTAGARQLHAAKSNERKKPYNYLKRGDEGGSSSASSRRWRICALACSESFGAEPSFAPGANPFAAVRKN